MQAESTEKVTNFAIALNRTKSSESTEEQSSRIATEKIKRKSVLGAGSFGTVYRAILEGAEVAIKEFKDTGNAKQVSTFVREEFALRTLRHPNIINLQGITTFEDRQCLILEFAQHGTLLDYIAKNPSLSQLTRANFATQVTAAVVFINEKNYMHRDLKATNVLMTINEGKAMAKLADFGSMTKITETALWKGNSTQKYLPPEALMESIYTVACEVFALGCVFGEIATGKAARNMLPIEGPVQEVMHIMQNHHNPLPKSTHKSFAELIQWCWQTESDNRPNLPQVQQSLGRIQKELAAC